MNETSRSNGVKNAQLHGKPFVEIVGNERSDGPDAISCAKKSAM